VQYDRRSGFNLVGRQATDYQRNEESNWRTEGLHNIKLTAGLHAPR
jgi:hypothetical protein